MTETARPLRMHGRNPQIFEALKEAGIIHDGDYVRRVIIDINVTDAVVVYVERYGDERLLGLIRLMDGMEIITGHPADSTEAVILTADELLLLRQRLAFDGAGTPAVDSALDAKLFRAQRELEVRKERA